MRALVGRGDAGRFYGQHGEDLLLAALLEDVEVGTFVEVGCIDGLRFSNTLHFEERGWRGLCVEAHEDYIELLRENRPGSVVVHATASEKDAEEVSFYANHRGSLSSVNPDREEEFASRFGEHFTGYEKQKAPMCRLDSMLAEAGLDSIDLLSVDVEGQAVEVLRGLGKYRPRVILAQSEGEAHEATLNELLWSLCYLKAFRLDSSVYYTSSEDIADRVRGRSFSSMLVHTGNPLEADPDRETPCELEVMGFEVHWKNPARVEPVPESSRLPLAVPSGVRGLARRTAGKILRKGRSVWARSRKAAREKLSPPRAVIEHAQGKLAPEDADATFLVVAGPSYNQVKPRAHESILMGYCSAFEELGVPYLITDFLDLDAALERCRRPFGLVAAHDVQHPWIRESTTRALRGFPCAVWTTPWFKDESGFFRRHGMPAKIWQWAPDHRNKVLACDPQMIFTGTTPNGLGFFECWEDHGIPARSMPFAYDPKAYPTARPDDPAFEGIELVAVGNYWASKARQIDPYLRPWEDRLAIYGRTPWPYRGYRGPLDDASEAPLFRQAKACPTINEPSVRLLHGQINERVFKVLGSGGLSVVDAIPAYRELFSADELFVPRNLSEFHEFIDLLLNDEGERTRWLEAGHRAVMDRHCYRHRAIELAEHLGMGSLGCRRGSQGQPMIPGIASTR